MTNSNEFNLSDYPKPTSLSDDKAWPPQIPHFAIEKPAYKKSLSGKTTNQTLAEDSFGKSFMDKIRITQPNFRGDWWQLGYILLYSEVIEQVENDENLNNNLLGTKLWDEIIPNDHAWAWHLENANLKGIYLSNTRFRNARFDNTDLEEAHFENAHLWRVHFDNTHLWKSHFSSAMFFMCDIRNTTLQEVNFENGTILDSYFENVNLQMSNLKNISIQQVVFKNTAFTKAELENARLVQNNLENADFRKATFKNAKLRESNLSGADTRGATGIIFDENRCYQMQISGNANDPWSVLRRGYTGPLFFIHLLLLIVFILPYASRMGYLTAVAEVQKLALDTQKKIHIKAKPNETPNANNLNQNRYEYTDKAITSLSKYLSEKGKNVPAIWVLLGGHRGWFYLVLTFIIIFYNLLRGLLTLKISQLRDAEERSAVTPQKIEYYGGWYLLNWRKPKTIIDALKLYQCHQIARTILFVSVGSFLWQMITWITETKVWLPY